MEGENAASRPEGGRLANVVKASPRGAQRQPSGSVAKSVIELSAPRLGEKHRFWCAVCDHEADATHKRDRVGLPQWFVGNAFTLRCPGRDHCLAAIAAELGVDPADLKEDPRPYLEPWLTQPWNGSRSASVEPPPTEEEVQEWHEALLGNRPKLRHLNRVRGLLRQTVIDYQLGYGSYRGRPLAFMHPVRDADGALTQLIESYWPTPWRARDGKEHKVRCLGRVAALYPFQALQLGGPVGVLIVTEGRWKALALNQCGFPAITSTSGTHWDAAWNKYLARRNVAVVYDCDAEHIARRRADEWQAVGINAWPVPLSRAGYSGKEGVDTALIRDGWPAERLRRFVMRSGRISARERAQP